MPTPDSFKPNLLADLQFPNNPILHMQDNDQRLDDLERFYGPIVKHSALDGLQQDDHKIYALAISATDRSAAQALELVSPDKKFLLKSDPSGFIMTGGRLQIVGQGPGLFSSTAPVVALDVAGTTTDRLRISLGNFNKATASRSVSLQFWGMNTAGTAKQLEFEIVTDAEGNGTNSLAVWDGKVSGYRLYLGSNGRFGIGLTVPQEMLQVWGNAIIGINSTASVAGALKISCAGTVPIIEQLEAGGALIIRTATNSYLRFDVGGSEQFRMDYNGMFYFTNGVTSTTASTGPNGAVPATTAGFLSVNIRGTVYKIPYFNT